MISISGIKNQDQIEKLPYFTKSEASLLIDKIGRNLDSKLAQLKKIGYFHSLKNNLYTTDTYLIKANHSHYSEFIANTLRSPSYLSLEYVLALHDLIPEGITTYTSITIKSSRQYQNILGTFVYRNLKPILFTGFIEKTWNTNTLKIATPAKALFDYLYLKNLTNPVVELTSDLRFNWDNFSKTDLTEFATYTTLIKSPKMSNILTIIKGFYAH
ncbi:MAG: hypothetical protein V1487_03355 [bacterium]